MDEVEEMMFRDVAQQMYRTNKSVTSGGKDSGLDGRRTKHLIDNIVSNGGNNNNVTHSHMNNAPSAPSEGALLPTMDFSPQMLKEMMEEERRLNEGPSGGGISTPVSGQMTLPTINGDIPQHTSREYQQVDNNQLEFDFVTIRADDVYERIEKIEKDVKYISSMVKYIHDYVKNEIDEDEVSK